MAAALSVVTLAGLGALVPFASAQALLVPRAASPFSHAAVPAAPRLVSRSVMRSVPPALARAIRSRLPGAPSFHPTWVTTSDPTTTLSIPSASYLGYPVAVSADGTVALVGAPGGGANVGAVYVFRASPGGSWAATSGPVAILTNGNGAPGDVFGISIALSADGTTAIIGAERVNSSAGAAYVFHVSSENSWANSSAPTATLTKATGRAGDYFGISAALSADGTTAIIGAEGVNTSAGAAYVFHVSSENSWASSVAPAATLTSGGNADPIGFGQNVALSADGTTALISDPSVNSAGNGDIFHVSSESLWASSSAPAATLTSGGAAWSDFGQSIALSADGTTALISAVGLQFFNNYTNAAYIFHTASESSWASSSTPTASITNPGGAGVDNNFGYSVALSADGTTAFIGATGANTGAGAAYIFQASSEAAWSTTSTPAATLTDAAAADPSVGVSVALSANGATAWASPNSSAHSSGQEYIFQCPCTPSAPVIGTAAGGNAQASVTFSPPASAGGFPVTSYTVTAADSTNPAHGRETASGASSPITVTGLTNGDSYTLTVTATNAGGTGPPSSPSNAVVPVTVPGPPVIGTATASFEGASASVTFSPPASNGGSPVTSYTVTAADSTNPAHGRETVSGASGPITVSGLTNGDSYTFTVTATNAVGTGPASPPSNAVVPATIPGAPVIGTATITQASLVDTVSVTFSPPASDGGLPITSYTVMAACNGPAPPSSSEPSSPITVVDLARGETCSFEVRATNAIGPGPFSALSNSVTGR